MQNTQAAPPATTGVMRKKRVLVIGPESWTIEDIVFIQEYLRKRDVIAKTFRVDEGIQVAHVMAEIPNVDAIVLVLGTDQAGWCNRNSGRLSRAAVHAEVKFTSIAFTNAVTAADHAQSL